MKLASLKDGRDGELVVVTNDLKRMASANGIAATMQNALDEWPEISLSLQKRWEALEGDSVSGTPFDSTKCAAPLPRSYHWADGSVYLNHMELVRKSRGANMPESFLTDALMYQGGSDVLLGPCDDIPVINEEWGIDLEAEVAVITDDVPMGISSDDAPNHIVLVMLANDVSLRNLIPGELSKSFGFYQSKPPTGFSPVAVTPAALGDYWDGRKLLGRVTAKTNGKLLGDPDAGADMCFDFGQLIAHAAKTRPLGAGTIIGSGTISNRDRSHGSTCIAEVRTIETIEEGMPKMPYLKFGDTVGIEMMDNDGHSIFGAINQEIVQFTPPR